MTFNMDRALRDGLRTFVPIIPDVDFWMERYVENQRNEECPFTRPPEIGATLAVSVSVTSCILNFAEIRDALVHHKEWSGRVTLQVDRCQVKKEQGNDMWTITWQLTVVAVDPWWDDHLPLLAPEYSI